MIKNSSARSFQNYYLGPASEFVHEMDDLSLNFGPLSTWTDGRVDGPQTAVFVCGGLVRTRAFNISPTAMQFFKSYSEESFGPEPVWSKNFNPDPTQNPDRVLVRPVRRVSVPMNTCSMSHCEVFHILKFGNWFKLVNTIWDNNIII